MSISRRNWATNLEDVGFCLTGYSTAFAYSDHIALLKAFDGWQASKREGRERSFCWDNFLSGNTLQMMEDMRRQFMDLLSNIGFLDKSRGLQVWISLHVRSNTIRFFGYWIAVILAIWERKNVALGLEAILMIRLRVSFIENCTIVRPRNFW